MRAKSKLDEHLCNNPPYRYSKGSKNKKKWIVNE